MNMGPLSKHHIKYLQTRHFNHERLIKLWGLRATKTVTSQGWAWRIVTPIRDPAGDVVGYTGRSINPDKRPRWRTTDHEGLSEDPKRLLYGIERVKDRILLVEGPSDVWRMGPGAVACFGIDWTPEQANIIRTIPHRFIMFDPETLAQRKAKQLASWLSFYPGETELITGLGCDPGDLSQKEAVEIRKDLGF